MSSVNFPWFTSERQNRISPSTESLTRPEHPNLHIPKRLLDECRASNAGFPRRVQVAEQKAEREMSSGVALGARVGIISGPGA
jgi:hypothetical protein